MFLIRESFRDDVGEILEVAKHLDTVNLPAQADHIERIVELSARSFAGECPRAEREFLFVLEDTETSRVVGTSMIHAQHGTKRSPHVFLQVLEEERYSTTLDRYMVHQCLRLGFNFDGPTEIGGLILLPSYRRHPEHLGMLLSYTRFLFIAMHRELFRDQVLSELLPPLEADGTSKLWKHFGKRFTGLTYREADLLSKDNKEFIFALFPHERIYTSLFPADVRDLIGQVGNETKGVEAILRRIGFDYANQIDPFDGGPHFVGDTDELSLVRETRERLVTAVDAADASRPWAIVATEKNGGFKATGARVIPAADGETVGLSEAVRTDLGVAAGEPVWMVTP